MDKQKKSTAKGSTTEQNKGQRADKASLDSGVVQDELQSEIRTLDLVDPEEDKLLEEDLAILDEEVEESLADQVMLAQASEVVTDAASGMAGSAEGGAAAGGATAGGATAGGAAAGGAAAGGAAAGGAAAGGAAAAAGTFAAVSANSALLVAGGLGLAAAAGGGGGGGGSSVVPVSGDTTAPTVQSMTRQVDSVVLTFDEPLDETNIPVPGDFNVTVDGAPANVSGVLVSGSTVTLNIVGVTPTSSVNVTYSDPTPGNDTNAIQDVAGNDAASFTSAVAADGYIRGGQVYIDTNGNGLPDDSEKLDGVVTDANGTFFLPPDAPSGAIIVTGGVNIDTGVPNTLILRAPAGSTVVSPLTTLVQGYMEANNVAVADASTAVATALNLPAGTDLTTFDPLAVLASNATDVTALTVQKAAAGVATLITLAAAQPAPGETATTVYETVVDNLVTRVASGAVDLTDANVVSGVLGAASTAQVAVITTAATQIGAAPSVGTIASVQAAALDTLSPEAPLSLDVADASDTGISSTDDLSNDATPTVRIGLETAATDGTAAVAGDTVTLYANGSSVGSAVLTAADISNGYVDITTNALGGDGSYSLTAKITDIAGNSSTSSAALSFTLDTTAPAAPTLALAADTGIDGTDTLTNNGQVDVSGLASGASWEYSVDNGVSWTAGSGSSFTLSGDGAKSVIVRQTDEAGNVSASSTALNFTLDTTVSAPTLALAADTGADSSDGVTSNGQVNVGGLESGASWEYSTDGGSNWTAGSGSSFTLSGDGNHSVIVRQTDGAGNVSANSAALSFTLDSAAPAAPTLALAADTGTNGSDGITRDGQVNVSGLESGGSWEYSTDNGASWTAGSGNSFTLSGDGAKSVIVRQTDAAGNVSASSTALTFTLDTTATAPTLTLAADTGADSTDGVTSNGQVNVSGLESGASWEYSIDGGSSWTTGSGSSFTLSGDGDKSVVVRQTDAAGNVSVSSTAFNFTLDTAAPTIQSMTKQVGSVALTFNEPLDGINAPATGDFNVTVDGVAATVSGVSVNGSTVTLTIAGFNPASSVSVTYTDPTTGNDTNAIQDVAGNDAAGFISAVAADGYIRGGQVYIDTNGNGLPEDSEKMNGVVTDANGNFFLPADAPSGTIIVTGGVNIDTGVPNTLILRAPANSTVVSPLTTLVQGYAEANNVAVADASTAVATALNLPATTDLTSFDPLAVLASNPTDGTALPVQQAAAGVATLIALAAANPASGETATTVVDTVVNNLVTQIDTGPVDLTDSNVVTGVLGAASTAQVADITAAATDIVNATSVDAITHAQAVALDTLPPGAPLALDVTDASDTGISSTDDLSNDTTPTVRIGLETAATDGSAVVPGDTVTLYANGSSVGSAVLTAADISNGYVDITTNALGGDGSYDLTAKITDIAGNVSPVSTALSFTLDTTAPAAPTLALAADTGIDGTDTLTNNGQVNVSGLESGTSWEYSTDGGSNWTAGSGSSFTLSGDGAQSVIVRQTDAAGNVSASSTALSFTLDTTPPAAPTAALAADTGANGSDGVTSNGQVNVSGLESGASWEYSVDNGVSWTAGSGSSLTLSGDGAHSVIVRQTDAAGNVSANSTALSFTLDTTAPAAPTLALAADTGADGSDALTNNGQVNVSGLESGGSWEYSTDGGSNWTAGSGSSFTLSGDGSHSVIVRQTDTAGNVSASSTALSFTLDTLAPATPSLALAADTGANGSDGVTSNGQVNVSGLEIGASWEYSVDNGVSWTAGSGSSLTLSGDGAHSVIVRQTDAAGNASASSTALNFTLATTVSAPTLALATDTGANSSDGVTSNGQVIVSGLESGASWEYSVDNGVSWTAGSGNSFTLSGDSAKSVIVRQTDLAGNVSASSAALNFTLDATAPAAPTLALAADTGANSSDGVTSNGQVDVSGLESGGSWEYSTDGGSNWTAGSGSSFTLSGDGPQSVIVRQTDAAGNVSANSTTLNFTLDTTLPAAPTLALAADTGTNGSDALTSNGQVNVSGLEIGASWEYSVDNGVSWTAGSGNSFTLSGDGNQSVVVHQIDAAGNVSADSAVLNFTLDTTALTPALALADDTGFDSTDGITSNGAVIVSGLEDGASWEYSIDGGSSWTIGSGNSFTLAEGVYGVGNVQVRQTDVAGNISTAVPLGAVTVDATAPAAPVLALNADTGNSSTDAITNDGTVNVSGLESGASWEYSTDGGGTWTTGTGAGFVLAEGVYGATGVQVRQIDVAGNTSTVAQLGAVTVDTSGPVPTITDNQAGTATGDITYTFTFNEDVTGFTVDDVTVANGVKGGFVSVSASQYTLTVTPTADFEGNVTVDVATGLTTDVAGNANVAALQSSLPVDTRAPLLLSTEINGATLLMNFSELLDAANPPATTAFNVQVNGNSVAVSSLNVSGATAALTLASPVVSSDTVTLDYTDPSTSNDPVALQDVFGNDVAGIVGQSVVNNTSTDTIAPTITGITLNGSEVVVEFSEAMTTANASGISLSLNPGQLNYWQGTSVNLIDAFGMGTNVITFYTDTTFNSGDVVRLQYDQYAGDVVDLAGNPLQSVEAWVGASAGVTIDLSEYGAPNPIMIFGDGGADRLEGTNTNNILVDGSGSDTLNGHSGADIIRLVENGTDEPYASDTVLIQPGDSVVGAQASGISQDNEFGLPIDIITGAGAGADGFDINSANVADHDKLSLPSGVIAADATNVNGTDVAGFAQHSITNGIITLMDTSGNTIAVNHSATGSDNVQDAIRYLQANLSMGETVGLKIDTDDNNTVDSLLVFQKGGMAPQTSLQVLDDITDTLVMLHQLGGIDTVQLGTTAGANVVQIVDTQAPEIGEVIVNTANNSFDLYAGTEGIHATTSLALTAYLNGDTNTAYQVANIATGPTGAADSMSITFKDASNNPLVLNAGDWLLASFSGTDATNSFSDAAGNVMDVIAPGSTIDWFAEGDDAANTIDLRSSRIDNVDINGNGGDDIITAASRGGSDINGGYGADTLNGGFGSDDFRTTQGDAPAVSFTDNDSNGLDNGDTFSFTGGKAEVVNNFGPGDALSFEAEMELWFGNDHSPTLISAPSDGLATDQHLFAVQGDLNAGTFMVNQSTGADTLFVMDGDSSTGISQTGLVVTNTTPAQFDLYNGRSWISYASSSDITPPKPHAGYFSHTGANDTINVLFKEPIQANDLTGLTLLKNGVSPIGITGYTVSGNTLTLNTNTGLSAGDYVQVSYDNTGSIVDLAGNSTGDRDIFIAGSNNNSLDMSGFSIASGSNYPRIFGNDGDDVITGTSWRDVIYAGEGSDIVSGFHRGDYINLYETIPARDIVITDPGDSFGWEYDQIFHFDVSGTSTNDQLGFSSTAIAADGIIDGTNNGTIFSHSISSGVITFDDVDTFASALTINSGNLNDVFGYLAGNITAGETVAFEVDLDGDALNESTFVYQQTQWGEGIVTLLKDVTGITLGTVEGTNVVQLVDVVGPDVNVNPVLTRGSTTTVTFGFDEALDTAVVPAVGDFTIELNAGGAQTAANNVSIANPDSTTGGAVISFNQASTDTDIVKVAYTAGANSFQDAAGNPMLDGASQFALVMDGTGNDTIDGRYTTSGLDVILANSGGADTIDAGQGADFIDISEVSNGASDTIIVNYGDTPQYSSGGLDEIMGFQVNAADSANNDILDLPSTTIAANTTGTDGSDFGVIRSHSISNGIIRFYSDNASSVLLSIYSSNLIDVVGYLEANLRVGDTVGFSESGDMDIFQKGPTAADSILLSLQEAGSAVTGLGTSAASGVVQLINNAATPLDITPPKPDAGYFTYTGANDDVSIVFREPVQANDLTGLTLLKNGVSSIGITGSSVSGNTLTLNTDTGLSAGDYVQVSYDNTGSIVDLAGNSTGERDIFIAGANGNWLDISGFSIASGSNYPRIFGNDGDDVITGSSWRDVIYAGEGSDTVSGFYGGDLISLYETTPARDIVITDPGDSIAGEYDQIFYFDVSGTGTNDQLGFSSTAIAADGIIDGTNNGTIFSHSISSGVITFDDVDAFASALTINSGNLNDVFGYLAGNITAGETVAFEVDLDGDALNESTFVYQQTQWGEGIATLLNGVTGITLGTVEGTNVVQLVDAVGPDVNANPVLTRGATTTTLTFGFDEALDTAVVPAVGDFTIELNASGALTAANSVSVTNPTNAAGGGAEVIFNQASTDADIVKVAYTAGANSFQDAAGNPALDGASQFTLIMDGTGNDTIDSSYTTAGTDIILANSGGADTITAGQGADTIDINEGSADASDTIVINYGDTPQYSSGGLDEIFGFQVNAADPANNDILDLPSTTIAANTTGTDGADFGMIRSHSISNGIIQFYEADVSGSQSLNIDSSKMIDVIGYLEANLSVGDTVGFSVNGGSQMDIFQKGSTATDSILLELTSSATITALDTIAANGTVHII